MFILPTWTKSGRTGPVRRFGKLAVFACEGQIVLIDERPNKKDECVVMSIDTFRERLNAVTAKYRNRTPAEWPKWKRQEILRDQQQAADCEECIKEAKHMGDPNDPQVQAFWTRHRRSTTIKFTDPILPDLPTGKFTGKTLVPDVNIVPTHIHRPATRKVQPKLLLPDTKE